MYRTAFSPFLAAALVAAAPCDLSEYKVQAGLRVENAGDEVRVTWSGASGQQLRAHFASVGGGPVVRELAARGPSGWKVLGRDLEPEFAVTTGRRRISQQQISPLREVKQTSPEFLDREKWKAFWDAPLALPGLAGTNPDLPRQASEIRRDTGKFTDSSCSVRSDGARVEVSFDGLTLGIFSGGARFTFYKGTNLIRQEAIAKTDAPSVAYHYRAGLRGLRIADSPRVLWRDVARGEQKYEFGGSVNEDPVGLRARNRLLVVDGAGALAVFPPPHKFFFGREIELNLGYVYYRKDGDTTYSVGVRQADTEEMYRPYGRSEALMQKRATQSRRFAEGNFALYNAPPGTMQRMAVYYYLSPDGPEAARREVLAFTHDDRYKALPGYQVAVSHFHTHFHEQLMDAGTIDLQPNWVPTFRALGINIAMMSDFHGDGHPGDAGPVRFAEQKVYFDGCRRHSDRDFLIMPGEEPDANFSGHYTMVLPRPVYWSHVRKDGQAFTENDPKYGKVYHAGSPEEELKMLEAEGGYVWQAHPRTKGSSYHPDFIRETAYFRSDHYLGGSFQSLPVDLSEERLCQERCLGTLDDMNNWGRAKYMIAEGDTYAKYPDDETYPHLMVNYVQVEKLPRFDEDWSPVLKAMRDGRFFVSSGEVLLRSVTVEGTGANRALAAEVEWTYPLEFVELVWGDGGKTGREVIRATDKGAFGMARFRIPFEAAGKKWVRFAAWDSAGNGAVGQPFHLR
ncbi:MAG: hypothetical protein R2729_29535 [Bryobacteraceae bacterium]